VSLDHADKPSFGASFGVRRSALPTSRTGSRGASRVTAYSDSTMREASAARTRPMVIKDIEYAGDGSTMVGRLALPEGDDQRPAVLIAHEGGGLDDYQKSRAERFAELGYVAFALDYHGGGKPLADENEIMARCQALWNEPDRIQALAGAGLQVLLGESRADASRVARLGTASAAPWCSNSPVTEPT
jgi:Dienelactone hydrolase family